MPCAEGSVWDGTDCTACADETQYYSVDAEGVTTCHAACPDGLFATGFKCGDSCANKAFKRVQIGEQSHNECVDECEHVYTEYEYEFSEAETYRQCHASCAETDLKHEDNKKCVSECSTDYWTLATDGVKVCAGTCDAFVEADGQCVGQCGSAFWTQEEGVKKCVTGCAETHLESG